MKSTKFHQISNGFKRTFSSLLCFKVWKLVLECHATCLSQAAFNVFGKPSPLRFLRLRKKLNLMSLAEQTLGYKHVLR